MSFLIESTSPDSVTIEGCPWIAPLSTILVRKPSEQGGCKLEMLFPGCLRRPKSICMNLLHSPLSFILRGGGTVNSPPQDEFCAFALVRNDVLLLSKGKSTQTTSQSAQKPPPPAVEFGLITPSFPPCSRSVPNKGRVSHSTSLDIRYNVI